ncbi:UBA/TS-N domain-containing protein [Cardiosporidium cionae]|uniref:UBA/TS-N domain-containing protein n=1 Tax=Cardiosporidium cionae TaxID=476202 RepID=A0ABQ7JEN2_9APIC|nr:UBA/TS-N domain-containing protein [Cardiosporidium cionae]|eukprot:KAF8822466.1 UBA/TS-N domain-containing protein [Cardiosporidium cionae]
MSNDHRDSAEVGGKCDNSGNTAIFKVQLLLYDISYGLARSFSGPLLGRSIEAIWHSSVLIYGKEFFYGGGINQYPQGVFQQMNGIQPSRVVDMGETEVTESMLQSYLISVTHRFKAECYDLINWNCNHFSDVLCQFLLGKSIPHYVLDLPRDILSSPIGQMLGRMPSVLSAAPFASSPAYGNVSNPQSSTQSTVSSIPQSSPTGLSNADTALPISANEQLRSSMPDDTTASIKASKQYSSLSYECEEENFPAQLHPVISALKLLRHSSSTKTQKQIALNILATVCKNIVKNPENPKFYTLKASNKAIAQKLLTFPGGIECLEALKFNHLKMPPPVEENISSGTATENGEKWVFIMNPEHLRLLSDSQEAIKRCLQDIEKDNIQETLASPKQALSNSEYHDEAQLLEEMGFTDTLLNIRVLREVEGNIEMAVTRLGTE